MNEFQLRAQRDRFATELRYARKIIRQMKRETNEFDEGRKIANKALKRINSFIEFERTP